jgi:hypothetical protein
VFNGFTEHKNNIIDILNELNIKKQEQGNKNG